MSTVIGTSAYTNSCVGPKAAPFSGGGGPNISSVVPVTTGTGANQANLLGVVQFSLAASSNVDKDLRADFLDPDGSALAALDVACEVYVSVSGNAAGDVNVTPSVSNGWDGLGDDVELNDGAEFIARNYAVGGLGETVDASNKSLNFANADASNAVTITAFVIGRDTSIMAVYNWTQGSIALTTGSAQTLTLDLEAGQATIGEMQANNRDAIPVKVRGRHKGLVPGEDIEQDFSLESFIKNETLTEGASARLLDILLKQGLYASDTTIDAYGFEWTLKVVITMNDGTNTGTITLPSWRPKAGFSEAIEGNKLSLSGPNFLTPTFT